MDFGMQGIYGWRFALIHWGADIPWLSVAFPYWVAIKLWLVSQAFYGLQQSRGWRFAISIWDAGLMWLRSHGLNGVQGHSGW